jgi:hypothetical protein
MLSPDECIHCIQRMHLSQDLMVYVCVFHCIQILEIPTSWVKLICEEEELMYRGKALLSCIREGIVVALLLVPSVS